MGIFEPYRPVGYITDGTPLAVQRRESDTFVTVSIGKAWQKFNCSRLSLIFVGPQLGKSIRALACFRDYTYAAAGRNIYVFERAHLVCVWKPHSEKVIILLNLGDYILSIDAKGYVCIWDARDVDRASPSTHFHLDSSFIPTCAMHPETYVDKVLIGSEDGRLQLWNIKSLRMVYEFKGWNSAVRTCVSSPALDVVAVGCADGKIRVHNIRYDETIVCFTHATQGSVTALSFRTDGQPLLAAGGSSGVISVWDLEKKKLQALIKDAHDASVSSLYFLANEPVLLSNSKDNSLKMWIFDTSDGEARLLRFRSGHSAPPTCIRYYGEGKCILSAGQDRAFRVFSTIQAQQSRELSQGHAAKRARKLQLTEEDVKLPPIVAFDAAEIRERDWANVVTCHEDDSAAYTWRLQNFVIGEHVLRPCPEKRAAVMACTISACGNFVFLGTASGVVERFNIQSGQRRGTYVDAALGDTAHSGAVHGLASDATNTRVFSAGYDGFVKVWNFKSQSLVSSISVGSPVTKMEYHRGSGLAAAASDDQVISIYDLVAVRLVRRFEGHTDRITDIVFAQDGKWLLSASMDATVRVWDVVAAKPLDAMQLPAAVTALSLSPDMDMLATCHVNHNGIYLWANRFMYSGGTDSEIAGSGPTAVQTRLPAFPAAGEELNADSSEGALATVPEKTVEQQKQLSSMQTVAQISPQLVTLAMLPTSQWQGLVHLETIKVRNRPVAAPKKPEKAPFFLPTLPSVTGVPVFAAQTTAESKAFPASAILTSAARNSSDELESEFMKLVRKFAVQECSYQELLSCIKSMQPSALDAELRMLQIVDDHSSSISDQLAAIETLLDFICTVLSKNLDFELVQALTQLVLKIHAESILKYTHLRNKATDLSKLQEATWRRVDSLFQSARCTISFLSNSAL